MAAGGKLMKIAFPKVEAESVELINRLCTKQCYFHGNNGGSLSITIAEKPQFSGYRLTAIIGSQTLHIDLASAQLQQWLGDILKETSFDSLPDSLQLELLGAQLEPYVHELKQQFGQLPVLSKLEPITIESTQGETLMLTAKDNNNTLCLWLSQGNNVLVEALPPLSSKINQKITLPIWLCLGTTQLSVSDFTALEQGDVVFFDHCYVAEQQVVFQLSGKNLWRCKLEDQTIQILEKEPTMNDLHNQEPITDHQQLPVDLTFDVGQQAITLEQLTQLQPGYVFELDQPITKPVTLRANGKVIGQCELVNVNDKLGVRLLEIFIGENA
ncbi:type III secretion system cytoplasmic ring protein SctQ [Vibrio tubiashii]|nr:type III secretion system cytoplasmic ring protein SctQ [Vibrio tubiashii]